MRSALTFLTWKLVFGALKYVEAGALPTYPRGMSLLRSYVIVRSNFDINYHARTPKMGVCGWVGGTSGGG